MFKKDKITTRINLFRTLSASLLFLSLLSNTDSCFAQACGFYSNKFYLTGHTPNPYTPTGWEACNEDMQTAVSGTCDYISDYVPHCHWHCPHWYDCRLHCYETNDSHWNCTVTGEYGSLQNNFNGSPSCDHDWENCIKNYVISNIPSGCIANFDDSYTTGGSGC